MTTRDRRLGRAVRLTPKDERARYAEEREPDGVEAGHARAGSPGFLRGRGIGVAALRWLGVLVVVALGFLGGGPFGVALIVVLVVAVVALTSAGRPSVLTRWLLVGSVVVGLGAVAYVWWVLGVQIDAADASTPPTAAAAHGGVGLVVLGLSIVLFVVSAIVGSIRRLN